MEEYKEKSKLYMVGWGENSQDIVVVINPAIQFSASSISATILHDLV